MRFATKFWWIIYKHPILCYDFIFKSPTATISRKNTEFLVCFESKKQLLKMVGECSECSNRRSTKSNEINTFNVKFIREFINPLVNFSLCPCKKIRSEKSNLTVMWLVLSWSILRKNKTYTRNVYHVLFYCVRNVCFVYYFL